MFGFSGLSDRMDSPGILKPPHLDDVFTVHVDDEAAVGNADAAI